MLCGSQSAVGQARALTEAASMGAFELPSSPTEQTLLQRVTRSACHVGEVAFRTELLESLTDGLRDVGNACWFCAETERNEASTRAELEHKRNTDAGEVKS